jgi:fido (protein-threonine AMPylation protein)
MARPSLWMGSEVRAGRSASGLYVVAMSIARPDTAWQPLQPLGPVDEDVQQVLASVDTLRSAWREVITGASAEEFQEARRRSLRRHAIETGIIERLYDVDWGVTEALVAEGLTAEVAAREGGLEADALEIIRTQYSALEFLVEAVREGRPLSVHFVRELHAAICAHQQSYEGHDPLGRIVQVPLNKGAWKHLPNHVMRPDGSSLQYAPPEQVDQQMDLLMQYYATSEDHHPVTRAAWLHHRFIQIHPFADGNGRVARALTLLVLLQAQMAPLVVDRLTRESYIMALDVANDGDLRDLVRLFARLEIVALRSELERPAAESLPGAGAVDVARAYVQRLRVLEQSTAASKSTAVVELADGIHLRLNAHLLKLGMEIRGQFAEVDASARQSVDHASPPDTKSTYWSAQIIRTARQVDFFANIRNGTWWSRLHLTVLGQTLRYVTCVQRVGHGESGVLALTVFAEVLAQASSPDEERPLPRNLLRSTPVDSVTLVYGDDIDQRWDECCAFIERSLAAALAQFAQDLG